MYFKESLISVVLSIFMAGGVAWCQDEQVAQLETVIATQEVPATEVPAAVVPQFSYNFKTSAAYNNTVESPLDPRLESVAKYLHKNLNQSIFFDPNFIRSEPSKVREYQLQSKPAREFVGEEFEITTDDGERLGATFFDRGSDTLLVIGEGFTNERENLSSFVAMFPEVDVVLFDFRGHGYRPFALNDTQTWPVNPLRWAFGIDCKKVTFGQTEHNDVYAVVDGFKRIKQHRTGKAYKQVCGLAVCYSAFIFLKSLSVFPGLFDKLILDGCWLSLPLYFDKVKRDMKTICDPQAGGWSDHWFFSNPRVRDTVGYIAENYVLNLSDISLLDFTPKIKNTPLLFFYGKDDYMVKRNEFEQLWNSLDTEKTVIVTSNPHVRNHLKQKELYKLICDLFLELPQDHLVYYLHDSSAVVLHYANKLALAGRYELKDLVN
jgi:pimeloyl-ACP methyl ester carboxylesterase